jgi:hypothetical protein
MENAEPVTPQPASDTTSQWAVVQTGYIDDTYTPVAFRDSQQRPVAIIIKMVRDEAEARRYMKRLRAIHARVETFPDSEWTVAVPIYGIAQTDVKAKKSRIMSEEERKAMAERLKAGRKNAKKK